MPHVQLPDRLYEQAQKLAGDAGFQSVDDYVADLVESEASADAGNFDHLFTPDVVAELEQIHAEMKRGGKALTAEEVDEQLRQKSQAWRETHTA
jgi:hypothetical protein